MASELKMIPQVRETVSGNACDLGASGGSAPVFEEFSDLCRVIRSYRSFGSGLRGS